MKKKITLKKRYKQILLLIVALGAVCLIYDGVQSLRNRIYYRNLAKQLSVEDTDDAECGPAGYTESAQSSGSTFFDQPSGQVTRLSVGGTEVLDEAVDSFVETSVDQTPEMPSETVKTSDSISEIPDEGMESEEYTSEMPSETSQDTAEPVMLKKFGKLYEQNQDIVGWLSIDGMIINYPVMQCSQEFYLTHNFDGEEDKYGCLFVKDYADVFTPGTNFIIYGHNMRDGSMFGDLDKYKDEAFYRSHSTIKFDTLYEERTYEIVAVFLSQVYRENDDVFKYYQFYQADTEEEFHDFYDHIKELSLYDTGVTAGFGDTFLTLSTCAYHVENGRFVVVAKRME